MQQHAGTQAEATDVPDEDDLSAILGEQQAGTDSHIVTPRGLALLGVQKKCTQIMQPQQQQQMIRHVRQRMAKQGTGQDSDDTDPQRWLQEQHNMLLPLDQFRAGITSEHLPAWQAWLSGDTSTNAHTALDVLKNGVRTQFVHPQSEAQQSHPRHDQLISQMQLLCCQLICGVGSCIYIPCKP